MTSHGVVSRALIFVLLLGGLAVALMAWGLRATLGGEVRAIGECRQRYADAHSLRDTAAVDMTFPGSSGRRRGRTCGDLRLAGRVR